ncbi:MAG TPA: SRPBCC family protein [Pseudonocardiaceae bacterium]|nr:SRPBCC family protein [Pseudonocardiaceae bacterium]
MASETRHLSVSIDRPAGVVYEFAADPANVPSWAPGLAKSVEQVAGGWVADSPMGQISFAFAPRNDFGVLDHDVTMPTGEVVHNPMRVIADGAGSEVVFTLRRRLEMSDEEFERDAAAVSADLATLKRVVEAG